MTHDGYEPFFLVCPISVNGKEIERSKFVEAFYLEKFDDNIDALELMEKTFNLTEEEIYSEEELGFFHTKSLPKR
jgi:hypothetical protein